MQGKNARHEGCHGAQGGMTRAPMVDALIPDTVFLLGEGERCKRGSVKIGGGTRLLIEGARADPKLHITETEDVGAKLLGLSRYSPGRRRKKRPQMRQSAAAGATGVASPWARAQT
jgi:hypothetical protein